MTDVKIDTDEGFLKSGQNPTLTVMSAGHALHVFINGQLSGQNPTSICYSVFTNASVSVLSAGNVYGDLDNPKLTFTYNVKLTVGINKISLLSVDVGLPNVGLHFETSNTGVLGPVALKGLNEGTRDLSSQKWSYKGEDLSLHTLSGSSFVEWVEGSLLAQKQPMTWYKVAMTH